MCDTTELSQLRNYHVVMPHITSEPKLGILQHIVPRLKYFCTIQKAGNWFYHSANKNRHYRNYVSINLWILLNKHNVLINCSRILNPQVLEKYGVRFPCQVYPIPPTPPLNSPSPYHVPLLLSSSCYETFNWEITSKLLHTEKNLHKEIYQWKLMEIEFGHYWDSLFRTDQTGWNWPRQKMVRAYMWNGILLLWLVMLDEWNLKPISWKYSIHNSWTTQSYLHILLFYFVILLFSYHFNIHNGICAVIRLFCISCFQNCTCVKPSSFSTKCIEEKDLHVWENKSIFSIYQ